jgi:hypothetical protein
MMRFWVCKFSLPRRLATQIDPVHFIHGWKSLHSFAQVDRSLQILVEWLSDLYSLYPVLIVVWIVEPMHSAMCP